MGMPKVNTIEGSLHLMQSLETNPRRVSDSDSYDGAHSQIIQLNNGDLLLFYHQSDLGHAGPDGRVVMRRSTDHAQSWSDETEVCDKQNRDVINPSIVWCSELERIVVFVEIIEFDDPVNSPHDLATPPKIKNADTYALTSTDCGHNWDSPTNISNHLNGDRVVPFGGGIKTKHGLLTCFYSADKEIQAIVSEDGGEKWNKQISIADSPPERKLCEPVPCRISDDRILIWGRDNTTGDFYAIKSRDGGKTWGTPVFFNPTKSENPKPIWAKKTGSNRITAVWGDRDDMYIYSASMSARLAWQDPTALADEPQKRLHRHIEEGETAFGSADTASYWGGKAGDFDYPTFIQLGPNLSDILVTFYDEPPWPNIWQMTLY